MGKKSEQKKGANWSKKYMVYFWHPRSPFDVKYEIEGKTGILLERQTDSKSRLAYVGSSNPPPLGCRVRLVFETALQKGNWYSLSVRAWLPRAWYSEIEFLTYANRAFRDWTRNLQVASRLGSPDATSYELRNQRVRQAKKQENRLKNHKEDPVPIREIKNAILEELRNGKSFRTAHHEGGTRLFFDGVDFVRWDYGEEESTKKFSTEEGMLDCIRRFYDWESRRDIYPHHPLEAEVWKFIQGQLSS